MFFYHLLNFASSNYKTIGGQCEISRLLNLEIWVFKVKEKFSPAFRAKGAFRVFRDVPLPVESLVYYETDNHQNNGTEGDCPSQERE